jgi:hypothetical protein
MKEWREYSSENDGSWLILSDAGSPEYSADLLSVNGESAVMAVRCKPGSLISCSIVSAAREINSVTGKLGFENVFYVQLYSMRDGWSVITKETYCIDDALRLAKRFTGLTKEQACKIWNMRKLGLEGNRIDYE